MKKFKIAPNAKPKLVKLDVEEDETSFLTDARRKPTVEEPVFVEESGVARPITVEPASLKRGGLMFLGGARPQAITGKSQLIEEMVAIAEAKKQDAPKPASDGSLVFVTPKYEEVLMQSGRTREVNLPAKADAEIPHAVKFEAEEEPVSDLKADLERRIQEARERYLLRKGAVHH